MKKKDPSEQRGQMNEEYRKISEALRKLDYSYLMPKRNPQAAAIAKMERERAQKELDEFLSNLDVDAILGTKKPSPERFPSGQELEEAIRNLNAKR